MHFENFLITQNSAIPIDLECMLYPFYSLIHSLHFKSLGAINFDYKREPLNANTRFNLFSGPHIRNNRVSILANFDYEEHSLFDENGIKVPLRMVLPQFCEGMNFGFNLFGREYKNIFEMLNSKSFATRLIIRPTSFYKVVQSEFILSPKLNKNVIKFRLKRFPSSLDLPVINQEIDDLFYLNVPFFEVDIHSKKLISNSFDSTVGLPSSPFEIWFAKCQNLKKQNFEHLKMMVGNYLQSSI